MKRDGLVLGMPITHFIAKYGRSAKKAREILRG